MFRLQTWAVLFRSNDAKRIQAHMPLRECNATKYQFNPTFPFFSIEQMDWSWLRVFCCNASGDFIPSDSFRDPFQLIVRSTHPSLKSISRTLTPLHAMDGWIDYIYCYTCNLLLLKWSVVVSISFCCHFAFIKTIKTNAKLSYGMKL